MTTAPSSPNPAGPPSTQPETLGQEIVQGRLDTTETPARYLALLARIRPLLISSTRYLAYTSDVGEAFRPVVNPKVVTGAYGVSIAYVVGDVAFEGYKGHLAAKGMPDENSAVALKVARRAVFQGTASMLFPALTIHSSVKYSDKWIFSRIPNARVRSVGPTAVGLAIIPFLPAIFDAPVEHLVDRAFDWAEREVLGRETPGRGPYRGGEHEGKPAKGGLRTEL